jgi:NitT/TauT family transport system ATP-binding protein
MATKGAIFFESVSKTYQVRDEEVVALDTVSFRVDRGQFVVLIGPSGCGKSTLLHCVGGFIEPTLGRIVVDDKEVTGPGSDRGIVFQREALFPWMTVEDNVRVALRSKGIVGNDARKLIESYLKAVGLREAARLYPRELSGGMQQRAAIARTLIYEPEVLLLDEPLGALDAQTRELLKEWIVEIWLKERRTVVYVTHDLDEAIYLAEKIVVLSARPGRVKRIINIQLEYPRNRKDSRYEEIREELWNLIREEVRFD